MKYAKNSIRKEMDTKDFVMHETTMGSMNVGYEVFHKDLDATELARGLPDDRCQSDHWGYVLKGKFKATYKGGTEETYKEGDVYYLKPGHIPYVFAGTELIEFSPKDAYKKTMDMVAKNMGLK